MKTDGQTRTAGQGNRFAWLPAAMPGVAALMAEKRATYGNAHVTECWRRGVVNLEPGWFFAREGALAVGTPWDNPVLANFAALNITSTQALVIIREPEAGNGAD
jgi:hypothetical protein